MEFDLNDTQRMMQRAAGAYLQHECPTARVRKIMAAPGAFDAELWQGMAEQGWLGLTLPESCGGLALGAVELAAVMEEVGRACAPAPLLGTLWAAETLATLDAKRHQELLSNVVAGQMRLAVVGPATDLMCHAELEPTAQRISLRQAGAGFVLSGTQRLVLDAAAAQSLLVLVGGEESPSGDATLLLVATDAGGVQVAPVAGLDATRSLADVSFHAVSLTARDVVAHGEAAQAAYRRGAQLATVALCADLVGAMQWILQTTIEYAQTRQQFGKPIGSFQAVQERCADMLSRLDSSRPPTCNAPWAWSAGGDNADQAVSVAKAYASEAAREVANRGSQVHGGIGFTWEHDLQLYYKRATSGELLLGNAQWHCEQLAEKLFS